MFKNLFSRMLVIYLAVTLSMLTLLGITMAGMFHNQYIGEKKSELIKEAEEVNKIINEKYFNENTRSLANEELTMTARKFDMLMQVCFTDENLARLDVCDIKNAEKWGSFGEVDLSSAIGKTISKGEALRIKENLLGKTASASYITVAVPMKDVSSNINGVIFMHADTSLLNESLKQIYLDLFLAAFAAIVLAVLAVSYLTGRITKPITEMNNTVKRFTKGQFTARVKVSGTDEVGQLARSFNAMADELDNLEQVRQSFVANVSHELRSPLTSMRGFLEAMQDGTIPPEEYDKYLEIVIDENKRMTNLVNDLLDLARIESGQIKLNIETFDINELIIRTLITFEARINSKEMDVDVDFETEHIYVEGDPDQIAQVLRNLIDNALKYSPNGGKLVLTSRAGRRQATVSVRDFGKGIPREERKYVFDRFYKVEKAHTRTGGVGGTGLGLSIVKRIIDQHGQTIAVDSPKGGGTRFIFTLKRSIPTNRRGLI